MSSDYVNSGLPTPETSNPTTDSVATKRKRRSTVRVACNACRNKKTRCDGRRPVCGACILHTSVHCVYDTETANETRSGALRRENEILRINLDRAEALLHELATLSSEESFALLKRLRVGGIPVRESSPDPMPSYGRPSTSPEGNWAGGYLPSIHAMAAEGVIDRQPPLEHRSPLAINRSTSNDFGSGRPIESNGPALRPAIKLPPIQFSAGVHQAPRSLLNQDSSSSYGSQT